MQPTAATTSTMAIKKIATKTIKKVQKRTPRPSKQAVPVIVTNCQRKKKGSVTSSIASSSSSSESEPERMKKDFIIKQEDALPMEETVPELEFEDPHEMCIFNDAEAFFDRRSEWETEPEKEKVCREWKSSEGVRSAEEYYFRIFGEQL